MPLDQAANFIRGSTDAAVDSTQTTVSVVDASIFPDPANGEYNVVIWDVNQYPRPDQDPDVEILRVTAVDTTNDDLTVTRAQEGTTGVSHPSGSAIHLTPTAKMFSDIQTKTSGLSDDGNALNIEESITTPRTVNIGVPSDFASISAALDEIRSLRPSPGLRFDMTLESGHTITTPVQVEDEDMGHVTVLSEDAVVPVGGSFPANDNLFEVKRGRLFRLSAKIDMQGNGLGGLVATPGIIRTQGSRSVGVINAGTRCVAATNASIVNAYENDFSGAGTHGAFVGPASIVSFGRDGGDGGADFSGAGDDALNISRGAIVRASDADLSNPSLSAIRADEGAVVYAQGATATGAGDIGIYATNSAIVTAPNIDLSNPTNQGIQCRFGAIVNVDGATLAGADPDGVSATDGAVVNVSNASVTGSTFNDLTVTRGGKITAHNCTTTNSTSGAPTRSDVPVQGFDEQRGIIHGNFETQ